MTQTPPPGTDPADMPQDAAPAPDSRNTTPADAAPDAGVATAGTATAPPPPPVTPPPVTPPPATPPVPPTPVPVPVLPWYRNPWLWTVLLLLLLLCCLGWAFWAQFNNRRAIILETHQQELRGLQGENARLEADIQRLRSALAGDPCVVRDALERLGLAPYNARGRSGEPLAIPPQGGSSHDAIPQGGERQPGQAPVQELPGQGNAPTPDVVTRLENATVLLLARHPSGLSMGTGFFINPTTILTNQHVVGDSATTALVVGKGVGMVKGTVKHRLKQREHDYAVITVPAQGVAPLAFNTSVARTQRVSAWGFPGSVTKDDPKFQALLQGKPIDAPEVIYSEGSVSVVLQRTPALIVHSAVVSQGNSGGPLVNAWGQVVGINTFIKLDDESYRQSSFAITSGEILRFLQNAGVQYTVEDTPKPAPTAPPAPAPTDATPASPDANAATPAGAPAPADTPPTTPPANGTPPTPNTNAAPAGAPAPADTAQGMAPGSTTATDSGRAQ